MDENKIIELWQTSNKKMEESLAININTTEDITRLKILGFLSSMKPMKLFALCVGLLWVGAGIALLGQLYFSSFSEVSKFFLFSATLQVGLTGFALLVYVYQIVTIHRIDLTSPIAETQQDLIRLKKTTLLVTRILFLQLPLWTTFYWNEAMFEAWSFWQWAVQMSLTTAFTLLAGWLFLNIREKNRDKKWFRAIFQGREWTPLMKSMELMDQLEDLKVR